MATLAITGTESPTLPGIVDLDASGADLVIVGTDSATLSGDQRVSANLFISSSEAETKIGQISLIPTSASVLFLIGGANQTARVHQPAPVTISSTIDGAGQLSFSLVDPLYAYRPAVGEPVEFWLNGTKEFSGRVQNVRESHAPRSDPTSPVGLPQAICNDHSGRLSELTLIRNFPEGTTGRTMWEDVVDNHLAVEGFELADGDDPGVVDDRLFQAVTILDFAQRWSRATGWEWRVDYDKIITLFDPASGTEAAPVTLADNDGNIFNALVDENLGGFANVILVRLSIPAGSLFAEFATKPDGAGSSAWGPWQLKQPITENSSITGVATGATGSVDPIIVITEAEYQRRQAENPFNTGDWHFKYTPGTNILEHKMQNPVFFPGAPGYIGAPVSLQINYATGEAFNTIITKRDETSITARAAIEGGSGEHHYIEELHDVESIASADIIAQGLLDRKSTIRKQFSFSSFVNGWKPGQLISSTYTKPPATDSFLIQSVTKTSALPGGSGFNLTPPRMSSAVTSINGPLLDSEAEIRRRLIDRDRPSRPKESHPHKFGLAGTVTGRTNDGLEGPTMGIFQAGTVTASGTTVTGTGTTFTNFSSGDKIYLADSLNPQVRTVDTVTDDTNMTVTAAVDETLTGIPHRKVFEVRQKHQILQEGPIVKVSMVFNEPPTGVEDATGIKRVIIDAQKNTIAAPTTWTSLLPGSPFKLLLSAGTEANVAVTQNVNIQGLRGEALRILILDANSDTEIRDGVASVHQYVGK